LWQSRLLKTNQLIWHQAINQIFWEKFASTALSFSQDSFEMPFSSPHSKQKNMKVTTDTKTKGWTPSLHDDF
jgi:hypothetical protein